MNAMQTIRTMEVVRHQDVVLQGMLGTDGDDGLG